MRLCTNMAAIWMRMPIGKSDTDNLRTANDIHKDKHRITKNASPKV